MLVDELGVPVSNEQKRIAVEPCHGTLEPNAVGQKDRDRHIVLAHMLQERVLERVRMRCGHDQSPWMSSHPIANSPTLCPQARGALGLHLSACSAGPRWSWRYPCSSPTQLC